VNATRRLLVIADDIGIGPGTTTGILQLGSRGIVTGTVLIVNSPHAEEALKRWRRQGSLPEIGWHPNLTLDTPIAPAGQIPSLVQSDGQFWPLSVFLKRWLLGRMRDEHIAIEFRHQLNRFTEMDGHPPRFLNFHQHVGIFAPIGAILFQILAELPVKPYVRRVQEPWSVIRTLPGARFKRSCLNFMGRRLSRLQTKYGFPGNDWLAGISKPHMVEDPDFFATWLRAMPGDVVELMCHPGELDPTLVGRDCTETDGLLQQRVNELRWLNAPEFMDAVRAAGFRLTTPSELVLGKASRSLAV
jgi:predicted glycoside hydrolase/deacetylase ChbG (UPF0249 family)